MLCSGGSAAGFEPICPFQRLITCHFRRGLMQTNARRFLEDYDPVVPVLVLLAIVMESASLYIMWS
jgi:hypothetical protein